MMMMNNSSMNISRSRMSTSGQPLQQQSDTTLEQSQSGSFQLTSSMSSVGSASSSSFQKVVVVPSTGTIPCHFGPSGKGSSLSFPPPRPPQQQQQQQQQQQSHHHPQSSRSTKGGASTSSSSPPHVVASFQSPDRPARRNHPSGSPAGGSGGIGSIVASHHDSSEWQKYRKLQHRLLLLRHASICQHESAGKCCPVTPHCAIMKKLWEHIAHCKNQQCQVHHCLSSRYVLSHYRRCNDTHCPVCTVVRKTIRMSKERERKCKKISQKSPSVLPVMMSCTFDPLPRRGEPSASVNTAVHDANLKGDASSLQSFTVTQLYTQMASLDIKPLLFSATLQTKCLESLKGLQTQHCGWIFNYPVDPVALGLPDYFDIIKKPMDLSTIQKKLENGCYHAMEDFQADVYLTFDNAMTYNEDGSLLFNVAKELRAKFEVDQKKLMAQLKA